jgi:hypothetical protein
MSIPLRHADLRGHRTAATIDAIERRDELLIEIARRFCAGMSAREAARFLRPRWLRYRAGAWRRDQSAEQCPAKHHGRIEALLWQLLRCRDAMPPSVETIRKALSRSNNNSIAS